MCIQKFKPKFGLPRLGHLFLSSLRKYSSNQTDEKFEKTLTKSYIVTI